MLSEKAGPSPSPQRLAHTISTAPPAKGAIKVGALQAPEKEELTYNNTDISQIPENDPKALEANNIVPGMITVVYKNAVGLRVHAATQALNAVDSVAQGQVNSLLAQHHVQAKHALSEGLSEQEVEADQAKISQAFKGEIPSRHSIHTYTFPKDTDLIGLLKKIRTLPFVRSADPVYRSEPSYTKTMLARTSVTTTGTAPSDAGFSQSESTWWWFNRQKVFNGWDVYGSTTMPTIAIIDTGFDTNSSAIDKPNYLTGQSITNCTAVGLTNCSVSSDVTETPNPYKDYSHGTMVATVAASPKNNGQNLAGIAPGASVRPYKVDVGNDYSIATAIRQATANSNVDVINVSITGNANKCPLPIMSSIVRTETASAFAAGKIIVFTAGNAGVDLSNTANCPSNGDGGAIIVGGAAPDTSVSPNRTKAWSGSNYDTSTSKADLAAAAENIKMATYDPNTGNRYTLVDSGTSFAAPQVAATAGMMKKMAQARGYSLLPSQIETLLLSGSDASRYTAGYTNNPETQYIGEKLADITDPGGTQMVGMRVLNTHNALVLAKYLNSYQVLSRMHNTDDTTWSTVNGDWNNYMEETYANDSIWGIGSLSSGDYLNYWTYNFYGGYAYGRSYLKLSNNVLTDFNHFGGVSGVSGAEGNANKAGGWYAGWAVQY